MWSQNCLMNIKQWNDVTNEKSFLDSDGHKDFSLYVIARFTIEILRTMFLFSLRWLSNSLGLHHVVS